MRSTNWQGGQNHLIFSVFPIREFEPSIGKSMRASSGLSDINYRPGFDISLPPHTIRQERLHVITNPTRKFLAVMPQIKGIDLTLRQKMQGLERGGNDGIISLSPCGGKIEERCDQNFDTVKYPDILSDARFCIVLDNEYDSGQTIMDALHHGCIPVIVYSSAVLPFSEVIDWKRFSLRIYDHDLESLHNVLSNVSEKRISEMQSQIHFVYNKYFSSWKAIINTTLSILNDRIIPHHAKTLKHWNQPPTVHEGNPLFLRYEY